MSKDLLNLSDEELMNLDPSALEGFTFGDESDSDYGDDSSVDDGAESTEGNTDDGLPHHLHPGCQPSDCFCRIFAKSSRNPMNPNPAMRERRRTPDAFGARPVNRLPMA